MTIRSRLVVGLLTIAVVLVVPFVYALYELDSLRRGTQNLQENEFAGSLILGRIREATDELRQTEIMVGFNDQPAYADSMATVYRKLQALADSLRMRMPGQTAAVDSAVQNLGRYVAEYGQVSRDRTRDRKDVADSIFSNHLSPAINAIAAERPALERALNARTADFFRNATSAAAAAESAGLYGLLIATLMAGAVAIWLTRSIGAPVRDLEKAMRTVSEGDLSYALRTEKSAPAEFSRLSRSYRSMVQQLAELDKLKAEFVSVASHELKTPINVVTGYLQLLEEGVYGDLNPRQREICLLLETQSQSLARLVHQLLDVSRFEAGGGRLETRSVDLDRFLTELENSFSVLAIQRNIEFEITRGSDLPTVVEWDEDRISEVIGNILSNAFKFTEKGGSVALSVYNVDGSISMEVRDTGAGIPRENLPHVFEKFYQAANQEGVSIKGTGLGLAIAREIVEAHKGTIGVKSTVGVGTTFFITLPHKVATGRGMLSPRRTPAREVEARL